MNMKIKYCLFGLLFSIFFVSCKSDVLVNEIRIFDNNIWMRFEPENFEVNVDNIEDCYDIYLNLVVDTARLKEDVVPLTFNMNSPNGERRMFRTLVNIKNKNGILLGEPHDDGYVYFKHKARNYFFFNAEGVYEIVVGQATNRYELHGIKSVELIVERAELIFPE